MSCTGSPVRWNISGTRADTQSSQLLREYSSQSQGHDRRDLAREPIIRRAGTIAGVGSQNRSLVSLFFSWGVVRWSHSSLGLELLTSNPFFSAFNTTP